MPEIQFVTDLGDPLLKVFTEYSEIQLLNRAEPDKGIFIAESAKVTLRALDAGYTPLLFLMEERQTEGEGREVLERYPGIPVFAASEEVLKNLTGYPMTRGILCAMRRKALPPAEDVIRGKERIAVLEGIVNPTNVGAIFRSAAALGIEAVLLTCDCSDPLYRRAIRVSMGTVFQVPWTFFEKKTVWPSEGIKLLSGAGFRTAALALSDQAIAVDTPALKAEQKLALLLGTEGEGLMADTIRECDYIVKIPMQNGVDSLNVAAASAVAFWETRKKRPGKC